MLSIDSSHPDLEEFIEIKSDLTMITSANISIKVDDEFMMCVMAKTPYTLHYKREETGEEIIKVVDADKIFKRFAEMNHDYAEPGILFWDRVKSWTLLSDYDDFEFAGVNPCAEESLPAGGSCLLGSINLAEFVDKSGNFDVDGFTKGIHISVKALNDVLDEGLPLHPLQEQRDSVRDWRQIGLGIFGLADMLIKMEIKYGSEDAIEISDRIGKLMINQSCIASSILASKEGTFPKFNLDSTKKSEFYSNLETSTKLAIEEHGMRNSQLLTIAPTGTLSTMLGISGGIEPMFATHYERRTQSIHGKDVTYKVYTPIVEQYMIDNNLTETSDLPEWFITSQELHYTKRIEMQATFQYHIDASISSTVNVPNNFTVEEVKDLYLYAHEKGLKGITIFRDGCKRTGILTPTIKDEIKTTDEAKNDLEWGSILDVNDDVVGKKRKLTTGCGTLHCTAFFDPITGNLVETYLSKGSTGGCNNFMVGLSRMMSLSARAGVEIDEIVDQLNSTGSCPSYAVRHAVHKDASKGSCCPMGIGYALKEMHEEMLDDLGEGSDTFKKNNPTFKEVRVESGHTFKNSMVNPCPTDGCSGELEFQGGCNSCPVCGWSQCS